MADLYITQAGTADILSDTSDTTWINRRDSQLLFGEGFAVEKAEGEWLYGKSVVDGYQGYVRKDNMAPAEKDATHIVDVPLTHLYPQADFKSRPFMPLGFMSRLHINDSKKENGFVWVEDHGWIFESHTAPENSNADSILDLAKKFLYVPYLYGGRTAMGIDCSGLVQLALLRRGHKAPRDSDQQEKIGESITTEDLRDGDLVFFKGHVGIMAGSNDVLSATARTMDVRIEPLDILEKSYGGVTQIKRI